MNAIVSEDTFLDAIEELVARLGEVDGRLARIESVCDELLDVADGIALTHPDRAEQGSDCRTPEQVRLASEFCEEIAGPLGGSPSPPDPVRLLEMAQALCKAGRG